MKTSSALIAAALLSIPSFALAQSAPNPEAVDKTVRASASALAQAQTLMLQIPDLVAQVTQLRQQLAAARAELAKLKPAAKPEPKKPAKSGGP